MMSIKSDNRKEEFATDKSRFGIPIWISEPPYKRCRLQIFQNDIGE